jgi:CTP:molybdopterin cytidylyltransferase MocA
MKRLLIIPAAGRGSRLGAGKPKPLVLVNGRPMLDHLADLYRPHIDHVLVVAHPSFAAEIGAWGLAQGNVSMILQVEPTGMLDAIMLAGPVVRARQPDEVWITWADQVGVLPATVQRLAQVCGQSPPPALALPTVRSRDPYTHFERDAAGRLSRFLQRREGDAMPEEGESDMGVFALARDTFSIDLVEYAGTAVAAPRTGERNFVPFVPWIAQRKSVVTFPSTDPMEAIGINTPEQLHAIEAWLQARGARNA